MASDEIVEEVRKIRDAYAKSLDHDLDAIFDDLKQKQRQSGREYVSHPPRKAATQLTTRRDEE